MADELSDACVPEGKSCLNEGCVGQGLWVVAEVMMGEGVHLFGVQPYWAGQSDEIAEQCVRFGRSSAAGEGLDEPE